MCCTRVRCIDGKSILGLAGLAAEQGTRLDLEASGPDAEAALAALAELISAQFHEDENGQPTDVGGSRPPEAGASGGAGPTAQEPGP